MAFTVTVEKRTAPGKPASKGFPLTVSLSSSKSTVGELKTKVAAASRKLTVERQRITTEDKKPLLDNRKLIETQMEKFKAIEKEMKTKAFSKEGLIAAAKMNPRDREKAEISDWLSTQVDELARQTEAAEPVPANVNIKPITAELIIEQMKLAAAERLPQLNRSLVHDLATGRYLSEKAPVLRSSGARRFQLERSSAQPCSSTTAGPWPPRTG